MSTGEIKTKNKIGSQTMFLAVSVVFSCFLVLCLSSRLSLSCKMGAVLCLFVLSLVATGVAYHLGYLDVYIEQAKQKINQQQQQQ
uniref:Uncharacterized protein n=1 Tax=Ditylenchus dipsaci TaxID=166011 RepID=A0A915DBK1_9BILA